jgi:hypothetical protein
MTGVAHSIFPEAGAQRVEVAPLGAPHLHDKWQGLGAVGGGDRFVARVAVGSTKATP